MDRPWSEVARERIAELERQVERLKDAVDIAREQRDQADSRAKAAVQAEMAALRARINDAELAILRGLPDEEAWLIPMGMPTLYGRLREIFVRNEQAAAR